ncbi:CaiB/BaiF CoA transferase family protein [Vibrio mediterranei]
MNNMTLPLSGLVVVDFSQFLAGPACSLRLADLGAEVIKVEKPGVGDICRQLYVAKQKIGDESTIFHAINRNKKSVCLDLKQEQGYQQAIELIKGADVVIQNFRPGIAQKLGIDYDTLKTINPKLVYGSVSGYGADSKVWKHKPGQDLLAQSMSGLVWNNGNSERPTPMGLAIADLSAAYDLTQAILSLLIRRGTTSQGGFTEVSLFESLMALQSERVLEQLNPEEVERKSSGDASGIYSCQQGHIAIGCIDINCLKAAMEMGSAQSLESIFRSKPRDAWVAHLSSNNVPCTPVLDLIELRQSEHYKSLNFEQGIYCQNDIVLKTTRCPITIDGERFTSPVGAPSVGEHNHLYL